MNFSCYVAKYSSCCTCHFSCAWDQWSSTSSFVNYILSMFTTIALILFLVPSTILMFTMENFCFHNSHVLENNSTNNMGSFWNLNKWIKIFFWIHIEFIFCKNLIQRFYKCFQMNRLLFCTRLIKIPIIAWAKENDFCTKRCSALIVLLGKDKGSIGGKSWWMLCLRLRSRFLFDHNCFCILAIF